MNEISGSSMSSIDMSSNLKPMPTQEAEAPCKNSDGEGPNIKGVFTLAEENKLPESKEKEENPFKEQIMPNISTEDILSGMIGNIGSSGGEMSASTSSSESSGGEASASASASTN